MRNYNSAKFVTQGYKIFKEKPDAKWKKGCGDLRTRPYFVKL